MFLSSEINFTPAYTDAMPPIDRKFYVGAVIKKNKEKMKNKY